MREGGVHDDGVRIEFNEGALETKVVLLATEAGCKSPQNEPGVTEPLGSSGRVGTS